MIDFVVDLIVSVPEFTYSLDISCKLSPKETICMKYQNLLSGKIRKISICHLMNLPEIGIR